MGFVTPRSIKKHDTFGHRSSLVTSGRGTRDVTQIVDWCREGRLALLLQVIPYMRLMRDGL